MHVSLEKMKKIRMSTLAWVGLLHAAAIGGFMVMAGCATTQGSGTQAGLEQPPAPPSTPVMPPSGVPKPLASAVPAAPEPAMPQPVVTPAAEPAKPYVQAVGPSYKVKSGDTIGGIAQRYGVSAREIEQLNGITDPKKLRAGRELVLPAYAKERYIKPKAKPVAKKPAPAGDAVVSSGGDYEVKSGDSLWLIASRNNTSVKAIKELNSLQSEKLKIGQKLKMPGSAAAVAATPVESTGAIDAGAAPAIPADTTAPVDATAPVVPADPGAATPVTPATPVDPAAPVAPVAGAAVSPAAPAVMTFPYTVKEGQTLDSIARDFAVSKQDLLQINGLTEADALTPGQKIKVPSTP